MGKSKTWLSIIGTALIAVGVAGVSSLVTKQVVENRFLAEKKFSELELLIDLDFDSQMTGFDKEEFRSFTEEGTPILHQVRRRVTSYYDDIKITEVLNSSVIGDLYGWNYRTFIEVENLNDLTFEWNADETTNDINISAEGLIVYKGVEDESLSERIPYSIAFPDSALNRLRTQRNIYFTTDTHAKNISSIDEIPYEYSAMRPQISRVKFKDMSEHFDKQKILYTQEMLYDTAEPEPEYKNNKYEIETSDIGFNYAQIIIERSGGYYLSMDRDEIDDNYHSEVLHCAHDDNLEFSHYVGNSISVTGDFLEEFHISKK